MKLRLATKFSLAVTAALVVIMALLILYQTLVEQGAMARELEARGNKLAQLLAVAAVQPILNYDEMTLKGLLDRVIQDEEVAQARAISADGTLKAESKREARGELREFRASVPGAGNTILGEAVVGLDLGPFQERLYQGLELIGVSLAVTGLVVLGVILLIFARAIGRPLRQLSGMMRAIAEGEADFSQTLKVQAQDEIGDLAGYFNRSTARFARILKDTEAQSQAALRAKTALDQVATSLMLTDPESRIIYLNQAVQRLFAGLEQALRQELPGFQADALLGASLELFGQTRVLGRANLEGLTQIQQVQLEIGGRTFALVLTPVLDAQGQRIGTVLEWDDRTELLRAQAEQQRRLDEERQRAEENLRVRVALDNVSSGVLMADAEDRILYMNRAAQELFQRIAPALARDLPGYRVEAMPGSRLTRFLEQVAHDRELLAGLTESRAAQLELGGASLRVVANPVLNDQQERLGVALEWTDRTAEVAVEREIAKIVGAARQGDLERRIELAGKQGFARHLGQDINELLDLTEGALRDTSDVLGALATGDLSRQMTRGYAGIFGRLGDDMNSTLANLEQIISQLQTATASIGAAARQVAAGNQDLSRRTEEQAASLDETANRMEQLTTRVHANAEHARQANDLAGDARRLAEQGGQVVGEAVDAMAEIQQASQRIGDILGVINEIAFQTNLLALNASVEAARAGEQGRGFAVVATEVRNLAQRSATAAKEIRALIQDSLAKVTAGTERVNQSGQTLVEIVLAVQKVGNIISEIDASSTEQSTSIGQVHQSLRKMDGLTQQNAALAEQVSAASASQSQQVQQMGNLMHFFHLREREA